MHGIVGRSHKRDVSCGFVYMVPYNYVGKLETNERVNKQLQIDAIVMGCSSFRRRVSVVV